MGVKAISISADNIGFFGLPGSQGDLNRTAAQADDTIFGQAYKSVFPAIINWTVNANAVYKGFAGYQATVKQVGSSTAMTAEACTLISGKQYQITAAAHQIMDRSAVPTVYDNGIDHTADVDTIDFLFGLINFKSSYTVTGPVTVTGKYFPTASLGSIQGFTLNMTTAPIDTTDYATAQSNGGYSTYIPGLQSVSLDLPGVYHLSNGMAALLQSRAEVIIEISPDGGGLSKCRGFFRPVDDKQSGNVGALEQETVTFSLSVPVQASGPAVAIPFGWVHANNSPIPPAVKIALDAWSNATLPYIKYLNDGVNGMKGQCVITSMTLTSSMTGVNTFQVNAQGSGAPTII